MNLKKYRSARGYTQSRLAELLGVSRSTVAMWESNGSQPDNDSLILISKTLNVSIDLLLDKETEDSDVIIPESDNIFPITRKKFPLFGDIACGEPIFAEEDLESYVVSGTDIQADFCLRAKGDSMVGARIMDGDIVFIRKMPMVSNGDIAAVIINDEATLKRVYYYPAQNKLVLNSENPKFEPFVYIGDELDNVHILGKAVAFQSDVR